MPVPEDIRRDLPPDLGPAEHDLLAATAMRLQAQRPNPAPSFRGELRRWLLGGSRRHRSLATPLGTRALAFAYATCGLLLLAVAAIGLAGAGPFAA
jgi:hypothetical protein